VELLGWRLHYLRGEAASELESDLTRVAAAAQREGLPAVEARALYFRSVLQYQGGDSAGARRSSEQRGRTQQRDAAQQAHELAGTALCFALLQKEMEKVETLVAEAQSILGPGVEKLEVAWTRGLLHHFHGELDLAAAQLERALALARQRHGHWEECESL